MLEIQCHGAVSIINKILLELSFLKTLDLQVLESFLKDHS